MPVRKLLAPRGPDPVLAYRLDINRGGHFTGPPELFSILKMRL